MARADLLVCDRATQSRERGEFQHFFAAAHPGNGKDLVEIGTLLSAPWDMRQRDERDSLWSIFDSSGVAAQDVAIAKFVMQLIESPALGRADALKLKLHRP